MFEWDTVAPAENWKHSHNYIHHTYTNILDKDRDIGYGVLRMDPAQKWNPYYLGNPGVRVLLMVFFQWGVMLHDLETERLIKGERTWAETKGRCASACGTRRLKQIAQGLRAVPGADRADVAVSTFARQRDGEPDPQRLGVLDHLLRPLPRRGGELHRGGDRGRDPRPVVLRQMLGSANITGSPLFHIMSGNLSHQIEHHLFPDIPARRYPQIAPEIRAICEKYGLPYNTGGAAPGS